MRPEGSGRSVVFVDRDGVIIRDRPHYVRSWRDVELLPGALAGLRLLKLAGHRVFVVTNQSVVGRGLLPRPDLDRIHARLGFMVTVAGGAIDAYLVCPHLASDGCPCRKPKPGLLYAARDRFGVDLRESVVVGDFASDIEAATRAGCRSILVLSGRTPRVEGRPGADFVARDLLDAAQLIVRQRKELLWRAA